MTKFNRLDSITIQSGSYQIVTIHYTTQRRGFQIRNMVSGRCWMQATMQRAKDFVALRQSVEA